MMYFRKDRCAECGAKPMSKMFKGRLANKPKKRVFICIIRCPHYCGGLLHGHGFTKEGAKNAAVDEWNTRQFKAFITKYAHRTRRES